MSRARFASNLISLYGVQFATLLLPLAVLPFLTRVLSPEVWGQLAAIQAMSLTLALLVEYGFGYSATRHVASHPAAQEEHARTAAQVLSAKIVLSVVVLLTSAVVYVILPPLREPPALFVWGVLFAIAQGFTPLWYFQGIENLRVAAATEVSMKAIGTGLTFLLVRASDDVWIVLALQAMATSIACALNTRRLYRSVPFIRPTLVAAQRGLREGLSMFLFRGAVGLYTTANAALLRAFVPGALVAEFATADRLAGASKGILQPFSQLLFPRISRLVAQDPTAARRVTRLSLFVLVGFASLVAAVAAYVAPVFIPWFFGPAYTGSVPLFQLLCLTFPVIAASNVLGVQWMLPHGMDRAFNGIIMITGLLNVGLILLLVPRFQVRGVVYAVLLSESFVLVGMLLVLLVGGNSPFGKVAAER